MNLKLLVIIGLMDVSSDECTDSVGVLCLFSWYERHERLPAQSIVPGLRLACKGYTIRRYIRVFVPVDDNIGSCDLATCFSEAFLEIPSIFLLAKPACVKRSGKGGRWKLVFNSCENSSHTLV